MRFYTNLHIFTDPTIFKKKKHCLNPKNQARNTIYQLTRFCGLGFSGFHELVGWVMAEVEREPNTLADTVLFIHYLTIDKLYTELYLRMH